MSEAEFGTLGASTASLRKTPATLRVMWLAAGALLVVFAALAVAQVASAELQLTANVTPMDPQEGDEVTVNFTLVNTAPGTYQNILVNAQQGNAVVGSRPGITITVNGTAQDHFSTVITYTAQKPGVIDADKGLTIQVQYVNGTTITSQHFPFYRVRPAPPKVEQFPILPVAAAAAAVVVVVLLLFLRNKKKAEEARLSAEAAAKKDLEKRAQQEAARELAATQKVHGKYPAEYFQRRRARLAAMVPSGMTSAGLSVLQYKKAEDKKIVYSCPRCGTHKDAFDAPCPRCSVQDGIESLRGEVKKHKTGADLSDVSDLLQQAEFQLSYSSYGEAQVLVDQAKISFNEILAGSERTVKVKKIETISAADRKATVLDLGLGTQHTTVDTAAEEHDYEAREAYAQAATHCPTCGHAIYGDLCAYCHFDDYAALVDQAIGAAAKGGAETVEPRDLLERARKLREEDNKSTGSRYLNRARFIASNALHLHLASKAEGMLDYARTLMLVGEEDGLTADFGAAEATLAEADGKRAGGDMGAAVDLASRAESEIHTALTELNKRVAIKRIDEVSASIDNAKATGTSVAAPDAKLKEARDAFNEGDFEKARDVAGVAKNLVRDATKGKTVCPKCGKPVQPTWEKCPFCTTPLRG